MTTKEFMNHAKEQLSQLTVKELKTEIKKLMTDYSDGAGLVWQAALDVLETKITEKEFVEFCDNL